MLRAITSALERRRLETDLRRQAVELRDRNQQFQTDLKLAREIQEAFLPHTYPVFPAGVTADQSALQFWSRYLPTAVLGGDFFDVFPVAGGQAGLLISDVMGHGVRAALVTAILRALADELTPIAAEPGLFLAQINRRLTGILQQSKMPMFATACYLVADIQTGQLHFAQAGHPAPLHLQRQAGTVVSLAGANTKPGPALGAFEDAVFPVGTTTMAAGDTILLYTDGLVDVADKDGQLYGEDRLLAALREHTSQSTEQLLDTILTEIHSFAADPEFNDDVCVLGMDVKRVGR